MKSTQTEPATSEKPIQNDWGFKICAQSGSGERKLTQTDLIKKKITQTEPATSEKPIQNEWGFKICAQSGSGERKLTQTELIKKKITQTEPTKKKITQPKPRKVKSTQTEPATSEKPIQKAIVLLEYDMIVLFVFFNGVLVN